MQFTLHLTEEELHQLHTHAEESIPFEAVALIFGTVHENVVNVSRIEQVQNTDESRTTFAVDPETQYRLFIEAEKRGEELVAIFHSHPAPPRPSARDMKNMELNPVVWLIASKLTGTWESRAFLLQDREIVEVALSLT